MKKLIPSLIFILLSVACASPDPQIGQTEITKWFDNKTGAVSITFDDGIVNQLTIAKPILDRLDLLATFYIITGKVEGAGEGKFIGRDPQEIIDETASIPTDSTNFFERASLIAFTGTSEAENYHAQAGSLFEQGRIEDAYKLIDEGFEKIRNGTMQDTDEVVFHNNVEDTTTWEQYKSYSEQGHEIASHTVTHPRLAVLDEVNMRYELEQSKADLLKFIGPESTFTAEGPYGTEDERVMEIAHQIYPALRNRMPEAWLEEINRGSDMTPGEAQKEYVQWQRGPVTRTEMDRMKSWVDTLGNHDHTWLVLVFHGVENLGWEPKTRQELVEYFSFIKSQDDKVWVAPFREVTKYLRERKGTEIETEVSSNRIEVRLVSELDSEVYQVPLTLKTYVPDDWTEVSVRQGEDQLEAQQNQDEKGKFVLYHVKPGSGSIELIPGT
ncbi:polysaccharide deacetylase family protein [Algoriphagus hitonicola]|uniref:Polysaccharide deacetylase n=1 Tax=Algoriphagus hitonicola TaxID=435880 RepID=A0A1I2T751_9BACT|nr:polysaccharide deacetylase family protein [Algoriphagus hitonicola]SFG60854.1 Polysaccharide deacetylase [Algoriphagus hitonicola]